MHAAIFYFISTAHSLCELCDDREVAFWCNDCEQWMCPPCKRSHLKARGTKDHDVTTLELNVDQIKRDVRQQATQVQQRAATMTSLVYQLQQTLEKLNVKQAEFLQQSDDLRKKYVQQINDHFDDLNAEAINLFYKEASRVRNKKKDAEKSLKAVTSRLQTLEELLADNSTRLAVQGKKILQELATFQKTQFTVEVTVTEPEVRLEETQTFDARDVVFLTTMRGQTKSGGPALGVHKFSKLWESRLDERDITSLKTVLGKTESGEPDPDVHKLSRLRERPFVVRKVAKLANRPQSVQCINDDIWTCQYNGTIEIFDRDLKLLHTLTNQQYGTVCDVTELANRDVVLAGRGGLFHLTVTGKTKTVIDKWNKYSSTVLVDGKLFAYCYSPPRLIVYTMRNDRWETRGTISLAGVVADSAYVTLATENGKVFACSSYDDQVLVLSQSGEMLQTHGEPGSDQAGELYWPYLCAVDSEESMLVADHYNDHLQVCDVSGQWSYLDLKPQVSYPSSAAVIDNKLYLCSWHAQTLSVYVSE